MAQREKVTPVHLGCKGHCIIADKCKYGRHTQVGTFRISTIGNYYIDGQREMAAQIAMAMTAAVAS